MADLKVLADAVIQGDQSAAVEITKAALEEGIQAKSILDDGLIAGMDIIGARFKKNEVYIPEVLIAARAMKMAMEILEPELVKAGVEPVGKLMIGTVQGDLHDIGKNIVVTLLKAANFEVIDLGVDISAEQFAEAVKKNKPDIVAMSALLTTTMIEMEKVVKTLEKAGLKKKVKIIIGGAPITAEYAQKIGADAAAKDAVEGVRTCTQLAQAK